MKATERQRLIRQGVHDTLTIGKGLTRAIERAQAWTDDGYPAGGGGVRGGDSDPLPLRKVLAKAGGDGKKPDTWEGDDTVASRLFELDRDIAMWVEQGERLVAFIAWAEKVAKHEDDRPTATCRDCNRTILMGWDALAQRLDRPMASRCTYSKDEPAVGCHGVWQRERRARQRAAGDVAPADLV